MPRKGPAPKRPLVSDPVYGSQLVTQLVSKVLQDGKKAVAQRIVYTALEGCREKTGTDPVVTLKRALDNVKPAIEVKSRRVGRRRPDRGRHGAQGHQDRSHPVRPAEPGRAGVDDLPGVRYKIIRGTLDTQGVKNRKQARSRYGAKKEK